MDIAVIAGIYRHHPDISFIICSCINKWFIIIFIRIVYYSGSGSSVGIATELRAGRSGIESRWERDFPPVQTGPGAHTASVKWVPGLSRG